MRVIRSTTVLEDMMEIVRESISYRGDRAEKKERYQAWSEKVMHGQFERQTKEIRSEESWMWLRVVQKHQIFRINFFFWIIVRNVLKLACVKYFYLIPSGNVPTLWSKFSYFQPNLPKRTHLGHKSVRLLLIQKNCTKRFLYIFQQPKAYWITYQKFIIGA